MDLEEDGNLLLESLQVQFEGAIGLCYTFENGFRSVRVQNRTLLQPTAGWQETIYFVVTSAIATGESPSGAICRRPSSDIKIEAAAVDNLPIAGSPLVSSPQETKEDTKNTTGELVSL